MLRPTISVVMATYQGERYVVEQLQSIRAQLADGDEIVVSDDASSDGTAQVIESLQDARIRLRRNAERVGYVRNFERAIEWARGEWIFFSDQDDLWLPEKVGVLSEALLRKACVASDAIVADEQLRSESPSYFALRGARSFSAPAIFFRPRIIGASMAVRRRYLSRCLPFPAQIPHDHWISLNAALDRELLVLGRALILYRRHANVASATAQGRRALHVVLRDRLALARAILRRRRGTQ
jgi:glycosyltransferase involved in cell wall biosynthesis